jgi:hypothetical protein
MLKDIYTRDVSSDKYDPLRLEVDDSLSDLIIKIENTLFTSKGSVLGVPDFGCNLDELIFTLVLNESSIERRINNQISSYCLNGTGAQDFDVNTQVQFFSTEERNGALVDIYINQRRVIGMLF